MFGLRRRRCPITRITRPRFLTLLAAAILVACSGGGDATGPDDNDNNPPPPPPAPTTGVISGRVTTTSGAALDGATVTTQPASGTATSDTQGNYSIAGVAPGSYTVTASKTGYNNGTATVAVVAGQTVSANLSLASTALPFSYAQLAQIQAVTGNTIASIAISPDGRLLAYGSFADNLVHIVDVTTRREIRTLSGHTKPVTELTFSPDSRLIAASTGTVNLPPAVDGSVKIWDVSTGAQLATVATPGTNQLVFTPNGSLLVGASGGDPVSIRVWNVSNLSLARTITGVFRFAALSPDASRVASGGRNSSLHVIDFATGTSLATHAGQTGWVTAAAYSANGQLLASASEDRTILIRNAQTGLTSLTLSGHTTYPDVLVFSPDGAAIASLGSGTNITRSGSQVSISISSADRFIRIWNVTTGAEYSRVNVGSDVIGGISFSSD